MKICSCGKYAGVHSLTRFCQEENTDLFEENKMSESSRRIEMASGVQKSVPKINIQLSVEEINRIITALSVRLSTCSKIEFDETVSLIRALRAAIKID